MSLNLHSIVRGCITSVYDDQSFTLYRSTGQTNVKGTIKATYINAGEVKGSLQSEGDAALDHANMAGQNSSVKKLYLHSSDNASTRPWSIYRPLSRSGDYLKDKNGAWWFVVAVEEDFSQNGWICLRVQLQEKTPVITIEETDNE